MDGKEIHEKRRNIIYDIAEKRMQPMVLKRATLEELDFFYNLKCEDYNMYWTGYSTIPPRENIERFYKNCMQHETPRDGKCIYIIWDGQEPAGYVYISGEGKVCDIPIAVAKEHTGKGLARTAIREAKELAREYGYERCEVYIREDNEASLHMYRACGFHMNGEYMMQFIEPLGREIKMLMAHCDLNDEI